MDWCGALDVGLVFFFTFLFAIAGQQLFQEAYHQKCINPLTGKVRRVQTTGLRYQTTGLRYQPQHHDESITFTPSSTTGYGSRSPLKLRFHFN